jgi:hypothetical protein
LQRALRRFAVLLVLAVPVSFIGPAGTTWGASPAIPVLPRHAPTFEATAPPSERDADDRAESAVVLVVLDGVRWQEVFGGADRVLAHQRGLNPLAWASPRVLMPSLQRLLDTRAIALGAPGRGADITATGPRFISMPGYLEIFAGRPDPGCESNECARPPAHTVADDVIESSGADDVAVVSSWPAIARASSADASRLVVSAGRKRLERGDVLRADDATALLLDQGGRARAFPGEGDYRPDAITATVALRVLESLHPRFLFVGLGDADEYGHRNDYHGYLEAIHASDAFLGDLFAELDQMGARGRHTTVLVTADHGRAYDFQNHGGRYPESGRVWLVAAGGDVAGHGLVAASSRHTLSDVAPTVRALLGIDGPGQPIPEVVATLGPSESPSSLASDVGDVPVRGEAR